MNFKLLILILFLVFAFLAVVAEGKTRESIRNKMRDRFGRRNKIPEKEDKP